MTSPNGHQVAPPQESPHYLLAEAVYGALWEEGDDKWSALTDEDREDLVSLAEHYTSAHLAQLTMAGFKVIPPGAIARPQSEDEAMAMVKAAKDFMDGQKRRGKLVGSASKKLIIPGVH